MTGGKAWYIPGWAAPRDGRSDLASRLRVEFALDVIWLPEYGNAEWDAGQSSDLMYSPSLSRRLAGEPAPVTLVGWSLGGMVAMELAAERPAKVERLVLLSTTAKFCSDETRPFGPSMDEVESMIADPGPETVRRFLMACYHPVRPKGDDLKAMTDAALEATTEQLRLGLIYLLRADLRARAESLPVPACIVHGGLDSIVPLNAAQELAGLLPNARLHVLPNAGHMLPETNAKDVIGLLMSGD